MTEAKAGCNVANPIWEIDSCIWLITLLHRFKIFLRHVLEPSLVENLLHVVRRILGRGNAGWVYIEGTWALARTVVGDFLAARNLLCRIYVKGSNESVYYCYRYIQDVHFYAPYQMIRCILFLSCLFVCLSVVNFNLHYKSSYGRDKHFIFGI